MRSGNRRLAKRPAVDNLRPADDLVQGGVRYPRCYENLSALTSSRFRRSGDRLKYRLSFDTTLRRFSRLRSVKGNDGLRLELSLVVPWSSLTLLIWTDALENWENLMVKFGYSYKKNNT